MLVLARGILVSRQRAATANETGIRGSARAGNGQGITTCTKVCKTAWRRRATRAQLREASNNARPRGPDKTLPVYLFGAVQSCRVLS